MPKIFKSQKKAIIAQRRMLMCEVMRRRLHEAKSNEELISAIKTLLSTGDFIGEGYHTHYRA